MVCRAYIAVAKEQKVIDDTELLKLKSAWKKKHKSTTMIK